MSLLQAQAITKQFGAKLVLNEVSLALNEGERMALVGENGVGKSTLFKILVGELTADSGQISFDPEAAVGYLPQENILEEGLNRARLFGAGGGGFRPTRPHLGRDGSGDGHGRWLRTGRVADPLRPHPRAI